MLNDFEKTVGQMLDNCWTIDEWLLHNF